MNKNKSVTLVEILLVVVLSSLLMTVIIPFIRSVNDTWDVGSGKTEILQNGRVALETMTRYIRQARRITRIPDTTGNYIKIRDRGDTFDIIFYHNIIGSPYYIGNTQPPIQTNDLVMQSNQVNSLFAQGVNNLTFNFLKDDGTPAARANQVKSVQIQVVLSDPLGSTTHTLALEDSVTLRQGVKIANPVWFSQSSQAGQVGELSSDLWIDGFFSPNSVSVYPTDGSCWVADTGNKSLKKVLANGSILYNISAGIKTPMAVAVNWSTGECWLADTGNDQIKKFASTGGPPLFNSGGFKDPSSISVKHSTGECWVANTGEDRTNRPGIYRLLSNGAISLTITGFRNPASVSVHPNLNECWVADSGNNRIKKISYTSTSWTISLNIGGFLRPNSVSVNPADGSCWVADTGNNLVKKIISQTEVRSYSGFNQPTAVAVDPTDGSCWVIDKGNNKIVKLNPEGDREFEIGGFTGPLSASVSP